MITNVGKVLIAKFLLGQAPAYASYLAIGCGAKPLTTLSYSATAKAVASGTATITIGSHTIAVDDYITVSGVGYGLDGVQKVTGITSTKVSYATTAANLTEESAGAVATVVKNYSTKTSLDFEMYRSPITSRGYVVENGVSKIVLTAELPSEERYEITEIGVFPAASNPSAPTNDSRTLFAFTTNEDWKYNASDITKVSAKLDSVSAGTIDTAYDPVFQADSDNSGLNTSNRINRQERCRFYNNTIFMRGNASVTSGAVGTTIPAASDGKYLELTNLNLDLSQNATTDEIRVAFSVVNRVDSITPTAAGRATVAVQFISATDTTVYAIASVSATEAEVLSNRYIVKSINIKDFTLNGNFSWNNIGTVRVYAGVNVSGNSAASTAHYVCIDAIRLENVSTLSSIYGLTGYTPIVSVVGGSARSVVKDPNVSNLLEFKYALDVT